MLIRINMRHLKCMLFSIVSKNVSQNEAASLNVDGWKVMRILIFPLSGIRIFESFPFLIVILI